MTPQELYRQKLLSIPEAAGLVQSHQTIVGAMAAAEPVAVDISLFAMRAAVHEAFLREESPRGQRIVLEEMQKGYTLNDKVIRHSKVKVAKNADSG